MYNNYMRIKPGESMQDWAKRVQQYEYGYALQQIARGEDVNLVMEVMSTRIVQKLIHPLVKSLSMPGEVDKKLFEKSRDEYYAKMKIIGPKADHVVDDLDKAD